MTVYQTGEFALDYVVSEVHHIPANTFSKSVTMNLAPAQVLENDSVS